MGVYRQARELFPLQQDAAHQTITVRIDALKEIDCSLVLRPDPGQSWVISKTSSKDAAAKLVGASEYKNIDWETHQVLSSDGSLRENQGEASQPQWAASCQAFADSLCLEQQQFLSTKLPQSGSS